MNEGPRKVYESPDDLKNEAEVIGAIYEELGCDSVRKLPRLHPIDYALLKGNRIVFFVEVKCRNNVRELYEDYMLSMAKFCGLAMSAMATRITSLLVVRWTDCIGILRLPIPGSYQIAGGFGGRTDRDDPMDIEPVMYIPVRYFEILNLEGMK